MYRCDKRLIFGHGCGTIGEIMESLTLSMQEAKVICRRSSSLNGDILIEELVGGGKKCNKSIFICISNITEIILYIIALEAAAAARAAAEGVESQQCLKQQLQ